MFSDRFDALMRIAELSNSLMGRAISMNSSHIGRLRTGARPLPKQHEFLMPMCQYLTDHIRKDYQRVALQKLTGIGEAALLSAQATAQYLERWLLQSAQDTSSATGRLISGFSRVAVHGSTFCSCQGTHEPLPKLATTLYGNAGKRKAVEQFLLLVLHEQEQQTLMLFSDENMAWLYEDASFAVRWAEMLTSILMKGNRISIVHTVSRDMNEMLQAVTKWMPIYMTGMIESYYYPRLRDGVFQRTMFIAPRTAAVVSSSVMGDTDGMLNLFLTDKVAVQALTLEYERYLAMCRPLIRVYSQQKIEGLWQEMNGLMSAEQNACLYSTVPPLFAMPQKLAIDLAEQTGNGVLLKHWERSLQLFYSNIQKNHLFVVLPDPALAVCSPAYLHLPLVDKAGLQDIVYTTEQYLSHIKQMRQLAAQHENLTLSFRNEYVSNLLIYIKEDTGVIMAKTHEPMMVFAIKEQNMISAFWDYLTKGRTCLGTL